MPRSLTTIYALLSCGALAVPAANAEQLSGSKIYEWIVSNDGALNLAATAYILGVADSDSAMQGAEHYGLRSTDDAPVHSCVSGRAKGEALRDSVRRMIDDHPALRKQHAFVAVRTALVRDYPCKNGGQKN